MKAAGGELRTGRRIRGARLLLLSMVLSGAAAALAQDGEIDGDTRALAPGAADRGGYDLNAALTRLAANPRDIEALLAAGNAALALGDAEAALGFLGRADQLSPGHPRIKARLASAMVRNENPYDAIGLFQEAERAGASDLAIAGDRGLAYDLVGDNVTAQRFYRQALARGGNEEVTRRLALSLAISGDRRGFEAAILPQLQRNVAAAWRTRAFALAILGEADEATRIAYGTMRRDLADGIVAYLRYMPRLTRAQQAAAANFGHFPRAAQIGRDDPRAARFAAAQPPRSTVRRAEAGLIPEGAPLGRARPGRSAAEKANRERRQAPARGTRVAAVALPQASPAQARPAQAARPAVSAPALILPARPAAPVGQVAPRVSSPTINVRAPEYRPVLPPAVRVAVATPRPVPAPPAAPSGPSGPVAGPLALPASTAPALPPASAVGSSGMAASAAAVASLRDASPPPVTPAVAAVVPPAPGLVGPPDVATAVGGVSGLSTTPAASLPAVTSAVAGPVAAAAAPATAAPPASLAGLTPSGPPPSTLGSASAAASSKPGLADAFTGFLPPAEEHARAAPGVDISRIIPARPRTPDPTLDRGPAPGTPTGTGRRPALEPPAAKAPAAAVNGRKGGRLAAVQKPVKPAAPSHPSRIWVQLATGRDKAALGFDWRRITREGAQLFKARKGWLTPGGQGSRLLVGPFESQAAAQDFLNELARKNLAGFVWTSPAGQPVDPLAAR